MRTWIKTIVNKFDISNHMALILRVHALTSYLNLICEYELHSLPNKKVSGAEDQGNSYIEVRPPLVRHLLRNRLLWILELFIQQVRNLITECKQCLRNQREDSKDILSEYHRLMNEEQSNLKRHLEDKNMEITKSRQKLKEERAKVERQMGHIQLDKEHLEKNELQLNTDIEERTEQFESEKSALVEKREKVQVSCVYICAHFRAAHTAILSHNFIGCSVSFCLQHRHPNKRIKV